jgi:hypothetical protein
MAAEMTPAIQAIFICPSAWLVAVLEGRMNDPLWHTRQVVASSGFSASQSAHFFIKS